jgi:hypothetical protein
LETRACAERVSPPLCLPQQPALISSQEGDTHPHRNHFSFSKIVSQ